jgi:hypothetical protein
VGNPHSSARFFHLRRLSHDAGAVASLAAGGEQGAGARAHLRLEILEERSLLTSGLVVVPSPVVAGGSLFGVAAIAHNDIWGVGTFTTVDPTFGTLVNETLAEHFNGSTWSVVSTPSPSTRGNELLSAAAAAGNDVWAVGFAFGSANPDFGESLIEHWNGSSWSVVSSPTATVESMILYGVTAVLSNDVWAVGGNNGAALVEHWNGTSWSSVQRAVAQASRRGG